MGTEIDMHTSQGVNSHIPSAGSIDPDLHIHSVQFYADDNFLLDEISQFVGATLGAGDSAVVIVTQSHREGLEQRLATRGLDINRVTEQGRYICLDAAATLSKFMVGRQPDAVKFIKVLSAAFKRAASAAMSEHPRIAAFGEMVALLWEDGNPAGALMLEELWNDLAQSRTFHLRCAYPMKLFSRVDDTEAIGKICSAHTHVIPVESYTSLVDQEERSLAITLLQQKAQALNREVSERSKAQESLYIRERELIERNIELREALAARDEFMSVAAHELKTPITSLRGFAQLLMRDIQRNKEIGPERLQLALSVIETQSEKLSRLVMRLLDSAQIEAGKLRIEHVRTDLSQLVRTAIAQQRTTVAHSLLFEGPESLEANVDPFRIEQVITNLLDNAVKFSPYGGEIRIELAQNSNRNIMLAITDEGIGIPLEQRESVFNRFHHTHEMRHLSGIGLGLYITREIVEMHGGSITIEQPEQPGTRFIVTLPGSPSKMSVH